MANLLWALATAQRAVANVFDHVFRSLVRSMKDNVLPKSQELSNSVWAFATAQMNGQGQESLVAFVADSFQHEDFVNQFKAQELSNTAWVWQ